MRLVGLLHRSSKELNLQKGQRGMMSIPRAFLRLVRGGARQRVSWGISPSRSCSTDRDFQRSRRKETIPADSLISLQIHLFKVLCRTSLHYTQYDDEKRRLMDEKAGIVQGHQELFSFTTGKINFRHKVVSNDVKKNCSACLLIFVFIKCLTKLTTALLHSFSDCFLNF